MYSLRDIFSMPSWVSLFSFCTELLLFNSWMYVDKHHLDILFCYQDANLATILFHDRMSGSLIILVVNITDVTFGHEKDLHIIMFSVWITLKPENHMENRSLLSIFFVSVEIRQINGYCRHIKSVDFLVCPQVFKNCL